MSLHPISDKAEVSVDFPDKAYIGSFTRHSQFDAYAHDDSVAIRLVGATWRGSARGGDACALPAPGGHSRRAREIAGLSWKRAQRSANIAPTVLTGSCACATKKMLRESSVLSVSIGGA